MKVQLGYQLTIASDDDPWSILFDALHLPGIGLVGVVIELNC